jgi:pimeloyl-ACP methyl ester carboxylesterase
LIDVALSACERRRLYVDLPGTGNSDRCEPSSDAIVDVLAEWIGSELGDSRFSLVGFSYGGYLALALAGRFGEQVERLLLVCSGTKIRADQRDLSDVLSSDAAPTRLDQVPVDLHDHFTQAVGVQAPEVASVLAAAFSDGATGDPVFLSGLRARYQLAAEESLTPIPHRIKFVAGRRDRIAGFRDQLAACVNSPNGDYALFAGAGHYLPFEIPDAFRAVADEWLA